MILAMEKYHPASTRLALQQGDKVWRRAIATTRENQIKMMYRQWLADKFNISGHLPSAGPVWLPAAARRSPVWGRGPGRARRWQRHTRPGDIVAQANASRS